MQDILFLDISELCFVDIFTYLAENKSQENPVVTHGNLSGY